MAPQKKKSTINPTENTPNKIALLSPGIDDNYNLLITTKSVTSDRKTPKKKSKADIRKEPKIDLGEPYSN